MKEKYIKLSKELNMQLKIPRHHLKFLKEKGSLDHFVRSKISGQDEMAKWHLTRTAKEEITVIFDEEQRRLKEEAKLTRDKNKLKMYGLAERAKKIKDKTAYEFDLVEALKNQSSIDDKSKTTHMFNSMGSTEGGDKGLF